MMRALALALALALVLAAGGAARAEDGMRCRGGLISLGATEDDVRARCGDPTTSDHREEIGYRRGLRIRTVVDVWTYDRGRNELIRILTFVDGTLRTIELGDYGTPR
jgi:hypothetical protein